MDIKMASGFYLFMAHVSEHLGQGGVEDIPRSVQGEPKTMSFLAQDVKSSDV